MDKSLNYEKTFEIELLNEFSHNVHARLLNFVLKNNIDTRDKNNPYIILLNQLATLLDENVFKLSSQELDSTKKVWEIMNILVKDMTKEVIA